MYVYHEFSRQWSDFSYGEFSRILGEFIAIIHKKWVHLLVDDLVHSNSVRFHHMFDLGDGKKHVVFS
jgi:hypothetical protein